jgi:hypothetical protein
MALLDLFRARCPTCGKRGLRTIQSYKATTVVSDRRAPAAWGYYSCVACAGRFRCDVGGSYRPATEAEWQADVEHAPERMS